MDPSQQPQVTLPHDNEVTESRGAVMELESESGSCFIENIDHDSDSYLNNLCDFAESDDDSGIEFRDIRLVTVESGSDDDDPEDEREIWGIDLNESDVYDDDDDDDVSVTIHSLEVEDLGGAAVELDWEEVDGGADVSPMLSLEDLARDERRDGSGNLEWQVLMNSHTLEINFDAENRELYIVGGDQYDLFFEQFAQAGITNLRFPPASEAFVKNLPTVQLGVENDDCAVCKDEMGIGSRGVVLQLPCNHKYHGECIVPWLETRNTCPVCRYELPTDDVDYERRKSHLRTS
ncbi:hypothetical protein IGI04_009053 [Brassica rapa subsp. trilocularis]|uniref:RING-type E3 ubiquitin transferase n=2 Tax=Brassica campestris TaxID=3711 RepID=M4CP32_BRACM|nr:E3 ubiquitin-protein ligase CIP8 [Brassica rapa]KAG5402934.1 hypothetical protein IGI04_009053 [Brassica rapa subsp. trilocularis]